MTQHARFSDIELGVPFPRYAADLVGLFVRTNSNIRRCVAFVGTEAGGQFVPLGTAFIVGIQREDVVFAFLATASHVLDQIKGGTFSLRLNRKSGGVECVKLSKSNVIRHKDEANDVALIPIQLSQDVYDVTAIPVDRDLIERDRDNLWRAELGDEVTAMGLYTSHYGVAKNVPVMRVGNLAGLPEEKVRGPNGRYVDGRCYTSHTQHKLWYANLRTRAAQ
jgi:hypothetical protein